MSIDQRQTTGTAQEKWRARVEGLLERSKVFFMDKGIMFEAVCEKRDLCDIDQKSFKAYLARWMAACTTVAPWTHDMILPYLQSSAVAAAQSCSGGSDGVTCDGNAQFGRRISWCATRLHSRSATASLCSNLAGRTTCATRLRSRSAAASLSSRRRERSARSSRSFRLLSCGTLLFYILGTLPNTSSRIRRL